MQGHEVVLASDGPNYLDPSTPVLAKNLEWIPIGDLRVGDEIWAFDEMPKGQARRTALAAIDAIDWSREPAFAVTTASGRTVVANKEHRFLSYSGGSTLLWRRLQSLLRPYGANKKAALAQWMAPWQRKTDFDAGWLSGMFDGEGSVSKRKRDGSSLVLVISQNAGPVLERVKEVLAADAFQYNCYPANGKKTTHNLGLKGGTREFMRFLGAYRPGRLLNKFLASNCDLELWLTPDPIVDITAVGMKDMIALKTLEGTCLVNGYAAHTAMSEAAFRTVPDVTASAAIA